MDLERMTSLVIGAAIRVHRELGPGFLESIYEEALCLELSALGLHYERQKTIIVKYREKGVGLHRLDLSVEGALVLELKTVDAFVPIHFATVRSYLKAVNCSRGLLLNFASTKLGVRRVGREWHSRVP